MVQRTRANQELSRSELSAYFNALSTAFDTESDSVTIPVGNKNVQLRPPKQIDCSFEVVERSSKLRTDKKRVQIELTWGE